MGFKVVSPLLLFSIQTAFPGWRVIVPKTDAAGRMTQVDRIGLHDSHSMKARNLLVQRLGLVDYQAALAVQKETELAVKTGVQTDTLLLLDNPHTLTVGRRGDSSSTYAGVLAAGVC